jgi:hypothetical protein
MVEGYVTEDIELDEGDEVSILAQPDLLNVYIEDVSCTHFLPPLSDRVAWS